MEKEYFFLISDIHTLVWIECPVLLKILSLFFRVCKWEVQTSCAVSNSVYCFSSFGLCEAMLESLSLLYEPQRLPLKLIVFVVFFSQCICNILAFIDNSKECFEPYIWS